MRSFTEKKLIMISIAFSVKLFLLRASLLKKVVIVHQMNNVRRTLRYK